LGLGRQSRGQSPYEFPKGIGAKTGAELGVGFMHTKAAAPAPARRDGVARCFSPARCRGLICRHAVGVQNVRAAIAGPALGGGPGELREGKAQARRPVRGARRAAGPSFQAVAGRPTRRCAQRTRQAPANRRAAHLRSGQ
jgi:hypothetical protein